MSDVNVQTLRWHHAVQRFPGILRELVSVFVNLETKGPRDLDVLAAIASQTRVTLRQPIENFVTYGFVRLA